MRYETRQSSIMLFQTEKAWRTSAPRFLTHGAKMQKGRGRIEFCHGRCFRAQFAFSDAHASPSLLAHAAGRGRGPAKNAPRGFLPSHGLPPTMAAFRRKAAQLQIQLRGKPRIPTGFLLSPPPRSAAAQGTMIRCILLYVQNTTPGSNCQCLFPSLPLFRDVHPKIRIERNPLRRQAAKGGWVRVWARTR